MNRHAKKMYFLHLKNDDPLPKMSIMFSGYGRGLRAYRYRRRSYPKWYKIPKLEPGELPGSIQAQYVKCGKPNCKCASGKKKDRHKAYYRFWRDDAGKLRKAYVKRSELEEVKFAIERRNVRLRWQRAKRNEHMRRGMGRGMAAHQWRRLNGSR